MHSVNVPETPNRQIITQMKKNVHLPSEVLASDWLLVENITLGYIPAAVLPTFLHKLHCTRSISLGHLSQCMGL
jgi:hypothetical protein